ncbi:MAG TPA: protein tyrosine phosphatase [Xanthobacteraceae bacterium]|jgi:predicted protein tyrosine phosphatase|nr:protein tyrosine phosphatase [Xanthobacteraceae bacterium]
MIHVCSLARLHKTVDDTGASHVVSLIGLEDRVDRPASIAPQNHLWLQMHDISEPLDGHIMPGETHVATLIDFVRGWNRRAPLVVHCYMGISRSTASAYTAVCALSPHRSEDHIAQALRAASPTATPNIRIVSLADKILNRGGRMVGAIESIRRGATIASDAVPFRLDLD